MTIKWPDGNYYDCKIVSPYIFFKITTEDHPADVDFYTIDEQEEDLEYSCGAEANQNIGELLEEDEEGDIEHYNTTRDEIQRKHIAFNRTGLTLKRKNVFFFMIGMTHSMLQVLGS